MKVLLSSAVLLLCSKSTGKRTKVEIEKSPFLQLPREIRDEILFYGMLTNEGANFCGRYYDRILAMKCEKPSYLEGNSTVESLLQVSKQIHEEARDVLFSCFIFWYQTSLQIQ